MKNVKFILIGIYFGIVLVKSEVVSWFRIQEMFLFDSFHMYGVFASAIPIGMLSVFIIKKYKVKAIDGSEIILKPKLLNKKGNIIGGIIFGFGWALTGACPGPLFALIGAGYSFLILIIFSATVGTLTYGLTRKYLPH